MTTQSLEVPLKGFGASPTRAQLVVDNLTTGQRLRRAGVALAAGGALALVALPIPLVHFVLVPGALLLGLIFAALRLNQRQVIRSAEGACPYCGTQMYAEQAHNRCPKCLYIEPCCDGAPLAACETRAPERQAP